MKLHDWQEEALVALRKHDFRGVVKVASGKGKTVLAIAAIKEVIYEEKDSKALVVVPTINLMHQWKKEIEKFLPDVKTSFWYGEKRDEKGQIVLSVINSASKLEFKQKFKIKILDEIHHYGSELYTSIFSLETEHTIGLSATPEREDEGDLAIRYGAGKIVYSLDNVKDLKERFSIINIRVPLTLNEYKEYMDNQNEYYKLLSISGINPESIQRYAKKGNRIALRILKIWTQMTKIRTSAENKISTIKKILHAEAEQKIIIFSESIDSSEKIGELGAIVVHSKMPKKEVLTRLEEFRSKKSAILVAPKMIDEGYDVPDANVAIIASFTRSSRQMIQRDGRVLRTKDFIRRYTIIIEGIEEEKYFSIMRKTNMQELSALWLKDHVGLEEDEDIKQLAKEYFENTEDYDDWLKKKLDLFERQEQMDSQFYQNHRSAIERIKVDYPKRWKILEPEKPKRKIAARTNYSDEEKRKLKSEFRIISSRFLLPDNIFLAVMRAIDGEDIEVDNEVKDYIKKMQKGDVFSDEIKELFEKIEKMIR